MRSSTRVLLCFALAVAVAPPGEAVRRRAFVTSATGNGNLSSWPDANGLGGVAAGDRICQERASDAGLPNSAGFRAWLSTASTDAYCHVQGLTGKRNPGCAGGPPLPAGPWYRFTFPSSLPVSEGLNDLVSPEGVIYRPVLFDEFGNAVDPVDNPPALYWTGTGDGGANYPNTNCTSWVVADSSVFGVTGDARGSAQLWTLGSASGCGAALRLLCLETGASEPTGQTWTAPGSLAFLTSVQGPGDLALWADAGGASGLAAADNVCRARAAASHLPAPGSFVAWLSDSQTDARDRVTSNGPFRRIDGVTVATSRTDLLDGTHDGSLHQFETGAYMIGNAGGQVFTGTAPDGTAAAMNCSDWTTNEADPEAAQGIAGISRSTSWTEYSDTSCSYSSHLYCFSNVVTLFWDGFEYGVGTGRWSDAAP